MREAYVIIRAADLFLLGVLVGMYLMAGIHARRPHD